MDKNVSKHRSNLKRACNLTALKENMKKVSFTFPGSKIFHLGCSVCYGGIPGGRLIKKETAGREK